VPAAAGVTVQVGALIVAPASATTSS
jgi:hypothetical protein